MCTAKLGQHCRDDQSSNLVCVSLVVQVVEKCHELGILHGDLKPANFVLADRTRNPLFSNDINLLFGEPWLLAIDFGCSQYLGSQRFTKRTGTPGEWQEPQQQRCLDCCTVRML